VPDADWERVRDLEAEELVRGPSPVPESALRKQQEARSGARGIHHCQEGEERFLVTLGVDLHAGRRGQPSSD